MSDQSQAMLLARSYTDGVRYYSAIYKCFSTTSTNNNTFLNKLYIISTLN